MPIDEVPRRRGDRQPQQANRLRAGDPSREQRDPRRLIVQAAEDAVSPALFERGIEGDQGPAVIADPARRPLHCAPRRASRTRATTGPSRRRSRTRPAPHRRRPGRASRRREARAGRTSGVRRAFGDDRIVPPRPAAPGRTKTARRLLVEPRCRCRESRGPRALPSRLALPVPRRRPRVRRGRWLRRSPTDPRARRISRRAAPRSAGRPRREGRPAIRDRKKLSAPRRARPPRRRGPSARFIRALGGSGRGNGKRNGTRDGNGKRKRRKLTQVRLRENVVPTLLPETEGVPSPQPSRPGEREKEVRHPPAPPRTRTPNPPSILNRSTRTLNA